MNFYLIPQKGLKKRAHIWNGADTACRMASTGGLKMDRYTVSDMTEGREVCQMCQNVSGAPDKHPGQNLRLWSD